MLARSAARVFGTAVQNGHLSRSQAQRALHGSRAARADAGKSVEKRKPSRKEWDYEHDEHMLYTAYEPLSATKGYIGYFLIVGVPCIVSYMLVRHQQKKAGVW
mmetsp:Transcript_1164/g.3612  ORF Transcript_1164/g.3612 Transcript_1164/m.3612 type:complete len:103 (+) Transcript_1164:120-428(+)